MLDILKALTIVALLPIIVVAALVTFPFHADEAMWG